MCTGFVIPLMEASYASFYTKAIMPSLIAQFASPDEEMKKIVLKVIKQVSSHLHNTFPVFYTLSVLCLFVVFSVWQRSVWNHNMCVMKYCQNSFVCERLGKSLLCFKCYFNFIISFLQLLFIGYTFFNFIPGNFWIRRMALDRRNYKQVVETTVELANKVGTAEIVSRIVEDLVCEG